MPGFSPAPKAAGHCCQNCRHCRSCIFADPLAALDLQTLLPPLATEIGTSIAAKRSRRASHSCWSS